MGKLGTNGPVATAGASALRDLISATPGRYRAASASAGVAVSGIVVTALRRSRAEVGPGWEPAKGAAAKFTTPLVPDDFLHLINPLWSTRELRGRVEEVKRETENAATLVIRPGWGFSPEYQAGQYISIGVQVDGKLIWRSYSLTSTPLKSKGRRGLISITVKAMPEGFLSKHLVDGLDRGTIVRLAQPQGEFFLPDPPPEKILFYSGGSGVTPVMGMLRTLARRGTMPDVVHIHSATREDDSIFREEMRRLASEHEHFTLLERFTDAEGIFDLGRDLEQACPDWKDREVWACGPEPLLDAAEEFWESADLRDQLHIERFTSGMSEEAEGGHVTFSKSGKETDVDGATTILEAAEELGMQMPFGCRMGICHTCTVPLVSGRLRDLRNGDEYDEHDEKVKTCVTAAAGDVVLAI